MPAEPHRALQAQALRLERQARQRLLAGEPDAAWPLLRQAAGRYRAAWEAGPPDAEGRLVGLLKAAVLGGDAEADARFVLAALPGAPAGATAAYAQALACLVIGDDVAAGAAAQAMAAGGGAFARMAEALSALARRDEPAYAAALAAILADFEARDRHLTGVPLADTALVLERLAEPRGLAQRFT